MTDPQSMNPKTCLITGVAGFLGSHVAEQCISLGLNVIGVDDLSGGFRWNVPPKVTFHEGSITDRSFIHSIFEKHSIDYVYHLAAYAAEGLSHFIRHFNYSNNVLGSINLINESINSEVKCFVFTSSIAVYGSSQTPMHEDTTPMPEDPYGVAKYAVELDLRAAHEMFGLNSIIFRPHNVYGERQNLADPYRNVIGIFMNQIMTGRPMTVFGDGRQTRAFSHVLDVAPILAQSVFVPAAYNQTFNIGADTPYSILELTTAISRAFEVAPSVTHLEPRVEVLHAYADHGKVKSYFNPPPCIDLGQGLSRMAQWAKQTPLGEAKVFEAVEIRKKLPKSWAALTVAEPNN
jgi:UDP-glucose 4-epimerase